MANSLEYPQRIEWSQSLNRVSVCSMVSSNFLIFPSFILLFLYSTVQKSAVQYSYLLASSLEYPQRIEWSQSLNRLSVCLFHGVIKFSNFSLFHPSLIIQYSTEECSTVQLFIYKNIAVMIDIDPS